MSYKDRTFCPFFNSCKAGYKCDRALTQWVKQKARMAEANILMYNYYPECYCDNTLIDNNKCKQVDNTTIKGV